MIAVPTLIDTNVLVYATDALSDQHRSSASVVSGAMAGRFECVLVPQVLAETFATLTGTRVKRPVEPSRAADYLDGLVERLPVLPVSLDSVMKFTTLARVANVKGQAIYDLFLVAQMQSHGIERICTCDGGGFAALGVEAVTPDQLLGGGG